MSDRVKKVMDFPMVTAILGGVLASVWAGVVAYAQPDPLTDDFQVNAYTENGQLSPKAATMETGFAVTWISFAAQGASFSTIQGLRLDAYGARLGGEFRISDETPTFHVSPSVAGTPNGGFVVVWENEVLLGPPRFVELNIRLRRFGADGALLDGEIQVNSSTTFNNEDPDVAVGPDGSFLVVWGEEQSAMSLPIFPNIQGRLYSSDGMPMTPQFKISPDELRSNIRPHVAAAPNGGFFVVWLGADGDLFGVRGRRLSADAIPLAADFQINTYTTGPQGTPRVAFSRTGEAWVSWHGGFVLIPPQPGARAVHARRFSPQGAAMGAEFRVAQTPGFDSSFADLVLDSQGNAFFAWQATGVAETRLGGQYYSGGSSLPEDLVINSSTTGSKVAPAVAGPLDDGTLLVVWYSDESPGDDTSDTAILGRLFRGSPAARIPTLGTAGFVLLSALLAFAALRVLRSAGGSRRST